MARIVKTFYKNYDLDATTLKYGRIGDGTGLPVQGKYGLTGNGSTTVTAVAGTPFDPVLVGDLLDLFAPNDIALSRKVAAKASGSSITTDASVATNTYPAWQFWPFRIGATAADGWHYCDYKTKSILVSIVTVAAAGGVDISIEGRGGSLSDVPHVLLAKNYAVATTEALVFSQDVAQIRVGVKGGTGFAGTDDITISLSADPRG